MSEYLNEDYWLKPQQLTAAKNSFTTTLNGFYLDKWILSRFKVLPVEVLRLVVSFLGIHSRWSWSEVTRGDIWSGVEDKEILQHRKFALPDQNLPTICTFKVKSQSKEEDWFSRLFCVLGIRKRMRSVRSLTEVSYSLYLSAGGKVCLDGEITNPIFPECHQISEDDLMLELLFDPGTSEVGLSIVDDPEFA